ncbi:MFS general substrate transporter [Setomelanomma holmii]|uniref:MFS general substrate transporter n=1 Tax=Setomelanomma holmii TaxID=210430 RepID=A0A9P4HBT6_9PLEO|nr:MFS general substrate transporter [Setomelanomma holmii]
MTDIEQGNSQAQTIEFMESSDPKIEAAPVHVSVADQTHIRRKFDKKILSIVYLLYLLTYLDRGNIGNAKTAGIMKYLHLTNIAWVWILPAHIYVALFWGACAMLTGVAQNKAGLITARAFFGFFEVAFGAGPPYFLSLFYQCRELGRRVALLTGMSPLANCFASSLAYGPLHIRASIAGWRLLFLVRHTDRSLCSTPVYFYLPASPDTTAFLTKEEKLQARERLQTIDRTAKTKFNWSRIFAGLKDYQNWVYALIHFCCNYSFAALSNFLATIVRDTGYSSVNAQRLTAPAYFLGVLCCMFVAWASDKYGKRGWVFAGITSMGTGAYLMVVTVQDEGGDSKKDAGLGILATLFTAA